MTVEISEIRQSSPVDAEILSSYGVGRPNSYPFWKLERHAFFHANKPGVDALEERERRRALRPLYQSLQSCKRYWERKYPGRKFQVRMDTRGVRVYRYE